MNYISKVCPMCHLPFTGLEKQTYCRVVCRRKAGRLAEKERDKRRNLVCPEPGEKDMFVNMPTIEEMHGMENVLVSGLRKSYFLLGELPPWVPLKGVVVVDHPTDSYKMLVFEPYTAMSQLKELGKEKEAEFDLPDMSKLEVPKHVEWVQPKTTAEDILNSFRDRTKEQSLSEPTAEEWEKINSDKKLQ